jgi:hypothetical protein
MTGPATDVVIVGAPRSGTNMLRDVLTSIPGVTTWPCDEINLIWRHGNRGFPSDELTPELARPEVASYIRRRFERIRRTDAPYVVEKTCANSLRAGFVRAVLPTAKYVLITRDGIDAAASAMARWNAPFDLGYTAAKARFVPLSDVLPYGARFVAGRLRRRAGAGSGGGQVTGWWGPRPADYRAVMARHPLDEVCALQWQRCVDASHRELESLPADQLFQVTYEDFVRSPHRQVAELGDFLGIAGAADGARIEGVSATSVGRGRATLGPDTVERLERLIAPSLERLGYVG